MARCFNVSGPCRTDKHYMVNLLFRLEEIRQMIDDGEYFVINKARQYGKTTVLRSLAQYLKRDYQVLSFDFQNIESDEFANGNAFVHAFARETKKVYGREMQPEELFSLAAGGDKDAGKIVSAYVEALGTGITNIANMFRPKLILLGGGIASCKHFPSEPLREILDKNCFGGGRGIELGIAALGNEAGMVGAAALL